MTDPEILEALAELISQVKELKIIHEQLVRQNQERLELLDELIADSKQRNENLDRMVDSIMDEKDDWWKEGKEPPY